MPEKKTTLEWGIVSDVPGEVPLTDKTIIDTGMKVDSEQQNRLKEKPSKMMGRIERPCFWTAIGGASNVVSQSQTKTKQKLIYIVLDAIINV